MMLLLSALFRMAQAAHTRPLAAEVGGSKRTQAFSTSFAAVLLLPVAVVEMVTAPPSASSAGIAAAFSVGGLLRIALLAFLLLAADFYLSSTASAHLEQRVLVRVRGSVPSRREWAVLDRPVVELMPPRSPASAQYGLQASFATACTIDLLRGASGLSLPLFAAFLLVGGGATVLASKGPPSSSSSDPLASVYRYATSHREGGFAGKRSPPPALLPLLGRIIAHILESKDSRRIFFFLVINVRWCACTRAPPGAPHPRLCILPARSSSSCSWRSSSGSGPTLSVLSPTRATCCSTAGATQRHAWPEEGAGGKSTTPTLTTASPLSPSLPRLPTPRQRSSHWSVRVLRRQVALGRRLHLRLRAGGGALRLHQRHFPGLCGNFRAH